MGDKKILIVDDEAAIRLMLSGCWALTTQC